MQFAHLSRSANSHFGNYSDPKIPTRFLDPAHQVENSFYLL